MEGVGEGDISDTYFYNLISRPNIMNVAATQPPCDNCFLARESGNENGKYQKALEWRLSSIKL